MVATTHNSCQLVTPFKRQFELCALAPGESVVFLTDRDTDREQVAAGMLAAAEMGNSVYEIRIDRHMNVPFIGINPLQDKGVLAALTKADLVVSFFVGFFAEWQPAIRQAGGRILNILDSSRQLLRLQGSPALRAAAKAAEAKVRAARRVHLTNAAGTDLHWDIDHEAPFLCHYGAADEPARMDHWGQGMIAHFPVEGSANGRVVVQPGDVWIFPYQRFVVSPIELEVRDGFIRHIGGGLDAKMFRYFLEGAKVSESDMDPFALSHLGWGLNPRARWDDVAVFNGNLEDLAASARAFPGNFLFSTGPGYKRKTKGHIDMPMCDCTIALDGKTVVDRGRLVDPAMIADPERAYH
jgi:2,5-dihydroxypyridine 5,6-dioxygenase